MSREKKPHSRYWQPQEEVALAQGWIQISTDSRIGNMQRRDQFWKKITDYFHQVMGRGSCRDHHQLATKYRDMSKKITMFNGIYNNLKRQWRSGSNDAQILTQALKSYKIQNNNKAFTHQEA